MNATVEDLTRLLGSMRLVDLSHRLEEDMPHSSAHNRFFHNLWDSLDTGSIALSYQLLLNEHTGTHVDATAHFLTPDDPRYRYIDETDLSTFFGRTITLDLSHFVGGQDATTDDVLEWERSAGLTIGEGDIVFFRFGWDSRWGPRTGPREYTASYPGIATATAQLLVDRRIKVVGTDAISIDGSPSRGAPCHYILLGNGVNIVENLNNLGEIVGESFSFVAPLKIKEGSAGPVRAFAFVHQEGADS
jgi:kynurenine formamidase